MFWNLCQEERGGAGEPKGTLKTEVWRIFETSAEEDCPCSWCCQGKLGWRRTGSQTFKWWSWVLLSFYSLNTELTLITTFDTSSRKYWSYLSCPFGPSLLFQISLKMNDRKLTTWWNDNLVFFNSTLLTAPLSGCLSFLRRQKLLAHWAGKHATMYQSADFDIVWAKFKFKS